MGSFFIYGDIMTIEYAKFRCGKLSDNYFESEQYWRFIKNALVDVFTRDVINAWASIYRDDNGKTFYVVYVSVYNGNETIIDIVRSLVGDEYMKEV